MRVTFVVLVAAFTCELVREAPGLGGSMGTHGIEFGLGHATAATILYGLLALVPAAIFALVGGSFGAGREHAVYRLDPLHEVRTYRQRFLSAWHFTWGAIVTVRLLFVIAKLW